MANLTNDEQLTKDTYDKYGSVWAKTYGDTRFYADELNKFNQLLPSGKVLEIGSGSGRDAELLIRLGYEYVGTDISDSLLKIAQARLPKAKFLNQSVYDLIFKDKFDGFWCTATLLHIPKNRIDEALDSIKSVLKKGAIGFITIKDGEGDEIEEFEIEKGKVLKRFYAYWSKEEFSKVLHANGFKILDYKYRPVNSRQLWHCFFVKLK